MAMIEGKMALRIEPLPEGGILVTECMTAGGFGRENFWPMLFACSTIDEALDFIRGKLAPVEKETAKPEPQPGPEKMPCCFGDRPFPAGVVLCANCPRL